MRDQTLSRTGVSLTAYERQVFPGVANGMNACVACCDRWAQSGRIGFEWAGLGGEKIIRTFTALQSDAARFANLLTARGVRPGDVVTGMLPRGPEMLTVILGTWRAGAVYQPISTSFSPLAIDARINHTGDAPAKLIVTDADNREKLDLVDFCPPVLVVTHGASVQPGDGDFMVELMTRSTHFAPVARHGDDPFLLLTGGDGGRMRPVLAKLRSLMTVQLSLKLGADPRTIDLGWDVGDPTWSFGLYFTVIRPLLMGHAAIAHESDRIGCTAIFSMAPGRRVERTYWANARHHTEVLLLAA